MRDGDIWLATADGSSALRLTRSGRDRQPAWSADGRRLVFVRGASEDAELYTIQSDGRGLRRLTSDQLEQSDPRWAPRGDQVAYVQRRDADRDGLADAAALREIWIAAADGRASRKLADGFDPAWSPDAQQLAFATDGSSRDGSTGMPGDNELRLVSATGSWQRLLLAVSTVKPAVEQYADFPLRIGGQRLRAPSWRRDGRLLAGSVDGRAAAVLTADDRGGDLRIWRLNYQGAVGRTVFAPRGSLMAAESIPATSVAHVLIVDTATGRELDLGSEQRDYSAAEPAWAPGGSQLAVVVWPGTNSAPGPRELVVFGADGLIRSRVAAGNLSQPAWNPAR